VSQAPVLIAGLHTIERSACEGVTMLTIPMVRSRKFRLADLDLDPSAITRSTTELATHDLPALVRRADVPRRIETGMDVASDAIRTAVEAMPGRRRRSSRRIPVTLTIVGVLAMVAITGWWMARGAAARQMEREFDEDALDRATAEGMSGDPDALSGPDASSPNGRPPETTAAELARILPA
jgi:hypothetical protein